MLLLLLISSITLVVADVSHFEGQGQEPLPDAFRKQADSAGIYSGQIEKLNSEVDANGFIKYGSRWVGGGSVIEAGVMIHTTATIYGGAMLLENCMIGPNAVVGGGAVIEARAIMGPGSRVEGGSTMGHDSMLGPHATLGGGQWLPPFQVRL